MWHEIKGGVEAIAVRPLSTDLVMNNLRSSRKGLLAKGSQAWSCSNAACLCAIRRPHRAGLAADGEAGVCDCKAAAGAQELVVRLVGRHAS